eukprot:Amastigsp_a692487_6.p3 type:complete len:100 gc:universal Amastigsp_a692487_6:287-586(+)
MRSSFGSLQCSAGCSSAASRSTPTRSAQARRVKSPFWLCSFFSSPPSRRWQSTSSCSISARSETQTARGARGLLRWHSLTLRSRHRCCGAGATFKTPES